MQMLEEGRSVTEGEDDTSFPFYRLDTGKRKYQQRRLRPQTESLESSKDTSSSGSDKSNSNRMTGRRKKRFVGVRQRSSGRWVAEIKDTTQKIRLWLGTFDTAEDAARAYDEAACMLRGMNTRTNFMPSASSPSVSVLPSKAARALHQRLQKTTSGYSAATRGVKKPEEATFTSSSPLNVLCNDLSSSQPHVSMDCFEEDEVGYKPEPAWNAPSFTSLLASPPPTFKGLYELLRPDSKGPLVNIHEVEEQPPFMLSGCIPTQEREDSPDTSADLSDTLSGLGDLVHNGESAYTSLFDISDIPMLSSNFEELSTIGGLSECDLAEIQGLTSEAEESSMLREHIRRMNFERKSSASLYAMKGVQELCMMRSGESTSNTTNTTITNTNNNNSWNSAPTFGKSPSFRSLMKSPLLSSCKLLKSPGWMNQSGNSPTGTHKNSEYQTSSSDGWSAYLCRVA